MNESPLLKAMNPPQKQAIQTTEGPLLILAGAGSGKTRVLTHRMAYIIEQGLAAPDEILCVTFTNKAAREMEHRIFKILADQNISVGSPLWISTFHSFCVRILRAHITLLGYKSFFSIYDPSDQLSQIKKVMSALDINEKIYPAKSFQSRISAAKMSGLSPDELANASARSPLDQRSVDVYREYENAMKKSNALDFDDLLLKTWRLFREQPEVLNLYREKFRYVMVDEYQDTNRIQYLLVRALTESHRNLCVVGDEDQSIYSWRGADIRNILDFEKDYSDAVTIKLEENYRSTGAIVKAATAVIKNNSQRKDKTLFTSNADGDKIIVQEEHTEYDEARFVAKSVERLVNAAEGAWQDCAIFYRTNAQSRVLEEQLRTYGIPYRMVGGVRFYERMEIKDIISYLKVSINPADDIALKRIINVPARGIGKTTIEKLEDIAIAQGMTLKDAISHAINHKAFNAGTTGKLRRFMDLIHDVIELAAAHPLQELYTLVLDKTDYLKALKNEDTPEADARIQNLEELSNAIEQFCKERGDDASLQSFLEEMALVSDQDSLDASADAVTMMTLHISKGLEYDHVFIVGLEENLFPSRSMEQIDPDDLEEERRLAYVGMTRARKKLHLSYASKRRVWGQEHHNPPSRFLHEIPDDVVEFRSSISIPRFASSSRGNYDPTASVLSFTDALAAKKRRTVPPSDFEAQSFPEDDYGGAADLAGVEYRKGMRVRHPTFGVGSIYSTEGSGDQLKVSVVFADSTIKKFVVKYARLERL